jgi:hypothetical protein
MGHESQVTSHGLKARVFGVLVFMLGSSALADHVPPAGLDSKGTWAVLISSFAWAYLDGQFTNPERIKYSLTEPEREWPFENGTSLERPIVPSKS